MLEHLGHFHLLTYHVHLGEKLLILLQRWYTPGERL
jgi:hypothetical protein